MDNQQRVTTKKRLCVFCQQPNKITREDVFPKWLIEAITPLIDDVTISSSSQPTRTGKPEAVVNVVCTQCNSGWMSRIQADVKPFLLPMMLEPKVMQLTPEQCHKLSCWAFMTAILLNFGHPKSEQSPITPFVYHRFYRDKVPPTNCFIFFGFYAGFDAAFGSRPGRSTIPEAKVFNDVGVVEFGKTVTGVLYTFWMLRPILQILMHTEALLIFKVDVPNKLQQIFPATGEPIDYIRFGQGVRADELDAIAVHPTRLLTGVYPEGKLSRGRSS